jgi:CheY-like chemotaxis protein
MKKKSILIADDSQKLLSALQLQLEACGYEIKTCTDAYMALAEAQKCRPDVMVLDIRMPAGDGFSVMERMAKLPELREIPVIYITGDRSNDLELKVQQLGAHGLIHKPISLSALLQLIRAASESSTRGANGDSSDTELQEYDVSTDADVGDFLRSTL